MESNKVVFFQVGLQAQETGPMQMDVDFNFDLLAASLGEYGAEDFVQFVSETYGEALQELLGKIVHYYTKETIAYQHKQGGGVNEQK